MSGKGYHENTKRIYTSTRPTDPHGLFGGTWDPIQDTFLWCAGPKHAAGTTGGEETHKLVINEMPSHTHGLMRKYLDILEIRGKIEKINLAD